jgi:hypothetical protein
MKAASTIFNESQESLSQSIRKPSRRTPKQASAARLDAKRLKSDYDGRYKEAFKDATNLVAAGAAGNKNAEPVHRISERLNRDFNLNGKEKLAQSIVNQAAKLGLSGTSPKKKGPVPKITHKFLEVEATHAEVCQQVGNDEMRGRDLKRLIGASIAGTQHEGLFQMQSVWRKVHQEFPDALQAANKIPIEDARTQWTTYDNLNQWFDDVR